VHEDAVQFTQYVLSDNKHYFQKAEQK